MTDWAEHYINLEHSHKELKDAMNDKKHSKAFSLLLEMQADVVKMQQYLLYCIDLQAKKY